jgi:Fe2+ or Zn2+ uptake regulation protein
MVFLSKKTVYRELRSLSSLDFVRKNRRSGERRKNLAEKPRGHQRVACRSGTQK